MRLRVLDLFSGIGGFSLGLERTGGFETAAFCEYEKFPRSILQKHWPDVPCFPDVRELKGSDIDGPIDVICGGYPCQPFSTAGQRRGKEDDRHLWPEFSRLVDELRPTWVIGENVAGHISMGLDDVLSDLEGQGYAARTFVIPACAVAAPHRRDRVWTLAHATQLQRDGSREHRQSSERQIPELGKRSGPQPVAHAVGIGQQGQGEQEVTIDSEAHSKRKTSDAFHERFRCEWLPEPNVGRVANGVPRRVDRLKALGNAVVPQIPEMIGYAILEAERAAQ
jgi:DNA (cytosine-5)-methyltransferase 1